jgi:hypothetical protein
VTGVTGWKKTEEAPRDVLQKPSKNHQTTIKNHKKPSETLDHQTPSKNHQKLLLKQSNNHKQLLNINQQS